MGFKSTLSLPFRFWIVAAIAFINSVSFTIIIPVLYPYAKQFGLSDFEASLLTTAYAASQFVGTPILGKLSDRLGRKPLLIASLVGTVVANAIACIAGTPWLLFGARILDGVTGGNTSIARAIVSDTTPHEQRSKAFGVFSAVFRLGFVAGPALSYAAQQVPALPGVSSLGMSFAVAGVMAAIAVVLSWVVLPETHPSDPDCPVSWQDFGVRDLVGVFQSAGDRKFGRAFILTFLSGSTFTIFTFAFQPFFLNVLEQDARTLAIVFAAIGILGFIAQVFLLDPLEKYAGVIYLLGGALAIRGLTFLSIPTFATMSAFAFIITVFGLVNSFPMPLIDSILSVRASEKEQGEVLGINASYLSLSNAIGPAIGGALVSWGYRVPFWVTGVLTLMTAAFALQLRSPQSTPAKSS